MKAARQKSAFIAYSCGAGRTLFTWRSNVAKYKWCIGYNKRFSLYTIIDAKVNRIAVPWHSLIQISLLIYLYRRTLTFILFIINSLFLIEFFIRYYISWSRNLRILNCSHKICGIEWTAIIFLCPEFVFYPFLFSIKPLLPEDTARFIYRLVAMADEFYQNGQQMLYDDAILPEHS